MLHLVDEQIKLDNGCCQPVAPATPEPNVPEPIGEPAQLAYADVQSTRLVGIFQVPPLSSPSSVPPSSSPSAVPPSASPSVVPPSSCASEVWQN